MALQLAELLTAARSELPHVKDQDHRLSPAILVEGNGTTGGTGEREGRGHVARTPLPIQYPPHPAHNQHADEAQPPAPLAPSVARPCPYHRRLLMNCQARCGA